MTEKRITPIPVQYNFLKSLARFPAFVSAWGTGKTMMAILKGLGLSRRYANNLGLIVRQNFTDLRDSTMKDFTRYTIGSGLRINSDKDVKLANGSTIMFRHADELAGIIQNVNLGWFFIEQAEEFGTPSVFSALDGRLRRVLTPDRDVQAKLMAIGRLKEYVSDFAELSYEETLKAEEAIITKLSLPLRQGVIIANTNGHNWIWKGWKAKGYPETITDERFIVKSRETGVKYDYGPYGELFEAKTEDNYQNLPADFLASNEKKKRTDPHLYNRCVLNSWEETDIDDQVIPWNLVYKSIGYEPVVLRERKIVTCDPADMGKDETVIYGIHNGKIVADDIFREADTYEIADRIMQIAYDIKTKNIVIDPINNPGLRDVLMKRALTEKLEVILADNRCKATCEDYFNLRTEIWFMARKRFQTHTVSLPEHDTQLQEELAAVRYRMFSDKKKKLDSKDKIRKADYLGHSPSRADALVNGLWAENMVEPDDEFDGFQTDYDEPVRANSYAIKSVL